MWNKELKTLDYISGVPALDLGYSAQFLQIALILKYLWNKSKVLFDVKKGAEDFGLLFV